jgi:hypothetical protein
MRKLYPQAILLTACLYATETRANLTLVPDTAKIVHTIDGNISEWKTDKFETDKETQVAYSMDHDADNFYLVIKVPDQRLQMKMMMQGMNLYIDKKGKKREGTGIEFPVKQAKPAPNFRAGGRNAVLTSTDEAAAPPDPKAIRENLAADMIVLKTFGFEDQEDKLQLLGQPGGIGLAFEWDADNVLYIEYQVPMSMLGKTAELAGKLLGIGWKINGINTDNFGGGSGSTSTAISRPGGSSRGGSGRGASSAPTGTFAPVTDSRLKEQSFWTKYTLNF